MQVLDAHRSEVVRRLCQLIVPGSERVEPQVYIDALLARMPEQPRGMALAAVDALEQPAAHGSAALAEHLGELSRAGSMGGPGTVQGFVLG